MNLEALKEEYHQLLRFEALARMQADYYQGQADILAETIIKHVLGNNEMNVDLGNHKCPASPTGICAYDADDHVWDFCLFCHDPDERK